MFMCSVFPGPAYWGGMRGSIGGGDRVPLTAVERFVFQVFFFGMMLVAGWFATFAFLKDYWKIRGCTNRQKYLFNLGEKDCLEIEGIQGSGVACLDLLIKPLVIAGGRVPIVIEAFLSCNGKKAKSCRFDVGGDVKVDPACEFKILEKGPWNAVLTLCWYKELYNSQECELDVESYSPVGKLVSLPQL